MKTLHSWKASLTALCFIFCVTMLAMPAPALAAGGMSIKINHVDAMAPAGNTQKLIVHYTIKNLSRNEDSVVFTRLNYLRLRLSGSTSRGYQETMVKMPVNYTFNPPLIPGRSKSLRTAVTVRYQRHEAPYGASVNARCLKYNANSRRY